MFSSSHIWGPTASFSKALDNCKSTSFLFSTKSSLHRSVKLSEFITIDMKDLIFNALHFFQAHYPYSPSSTLAADPYWLLLWQWCKSPSQHHVFHPVYVIAKTDFHTWRQHVLNSYKDTRCTLSSPFLKLAVTRMSTEMTTARSKGTDALHVWWITVIKLCPWAPHSSVMSPCYLLP